MPSPRIAAIHYAKGQLARPILEEFVAELKTRGVTVHGLFQEVLWDENGERQGTDAIDIQTQERIPLKRPNAHERNSRVCSLSLSRLAEATMVLRRALEADADVVVVERFGKAERDGGGLADDLLALMANGTPTMITVPEAELEPWREFSGNLGDVIACDVDALLAWWDQTA